MAKLSKFQDPVLLVHTCMKHTKATTNNKRKFSTYRVVLCKVDIAIHCNVACVWKLLRHCRVRSTCCGSTAGLLAYVFLFKYLLFIYLFMNYLLLFIYLLHANSHNLLMLKLYDKYMKG
jgi:hypothetical protein